jgi:hypothetical protein
VSERVLGVIVRIQIQRSALKSEGRGYDPGPLLAVDEAVLGPLGITGTYGGTRVMDVHHGAHPRARGGGRRSLSIGFTGHYDLMSERFGEVPPGIAGENLIVGRTGRLYHADLAGTLVIRGRRGDAAVGGARKATPCREFTSFLLGRDEVAPREEIAADLAFLDEGMRGFILDPSGLSGPFPIRVGDEVLSIS